MGGMSGFNMMHPFAWFASSGDATGDISHNHASPSDGNFFNDHGVMSGVAHPADVAALSHPAATGAPFPLGTYAAYVNSSLQNPGSQQPLSGSPTVMNGPPQGPWYVSHYNAAIPSGYISAAPPWKNGPMMMAANSLPPEAQAAIHATGTNPPAAAAVTVHHTNPAGVLRDSSSAAQNGGGGTCAGCSGGCGGGKKSASFCRGRTQQAVGFDSTNDFPPLYSHYQATPNQTVNAALYAGVSTHTPAWAVAQGAAADHEHPLQGQ